ncbi:organic cation transporter protein-like [Clytia hemisphaerica]
MATGYQEVLTSSIGSFGVAQFWISAASITPKITTAISMIMIGFSSSEPKWYRENVVFNQTTNSTIVNQYAKSCTFGVNDTLNYNTPFETIVTEWRLICDESFIPTTIQTTQMVGVLFGSASFGQLGDLIGRKYCLQISQLLQIIALLIQGLSYNWYMFICSSFLLGLGAGGFLVVTNIYMLEFIGTKWRTLCATFPAWGMGVILFGALIKALPNWRHMCYLAAALNVPMVCISLFTPRSPRWLFTNGKAEQGKEALVKLAKQNKNETPDFVLLEKLIDEETRKEKQSGSYTYMSLFKFSSTRKKTLLLSYVW